MQKKNKYNHKMRFWLYFGFADVTIAMENIMNKIKITIQKKTNQPTTIICESRRKYRFGAICYEKKEMLYRMCNMHSTKSQRVHGLSSVVAFLLCFAFIQLDCFARWFCQQMNVMRRTTVQHKSIHGTGNKFIQQFATDQETPSETCGLSLNWNQIQAISLCVHYESILSLSAIVLGFCFHLYFFLNWWIIDSLNKKIKFQCLLQKRKISFAFLHWVQNKFFKIWRASG